MLPLEDSCVCFSFFVFLFFFPPTLTEIVGWGRCWYDPERVKLEISSRSWCELFYCPGLGSDQRRCRIIMTRRIIITYSACAIYSNTSLWLVGAMATNYSKSVHDAKLGEVITSNRRKETIYLFYIGLISSAREFVKNFERYEVGLGRIFTTQCGPTSFVFVATWLEQ